MNKMIWFCYGIVFKYDLINIDYGEYRFNVVNIEMI